MVKVDIGPWRSSGIRIFSVSLIAFPDLCFHDTLACGLDRGGRWFLCQPLQSPDIFEAHFAADTAEDERALTARVVDVGGEGSVRWTNHRGVLGLYVAVEVERPRRSPRAPLRWARY